MGRATIVETGLFMMTRFPQPGYTKTRMIPALGPEGAAWLQQRMTEHLLQRFVGLHHHRELSFEVHFTGATSTQMLDWLGHQVVLKAQCEGNLGQRLSYAFEQGFADGLSRILVMGSDCPSLGEAHIFQALKLLNTRDVVLGPAEDGGYYLIGLKAPQPELFEGITWGQSCVLEQTLAIANRYCLSTSLLKSLPDIDRPEDLPLWIRYLEESSSRPQVRS
ncbi:TIGR04282 family arsenosugar biosynthesis glycosyltransferase [Oscillatoria sp. CS-180]|uniref:TIGR04282 family arsenosugar biosynthesis glycosyltransferase n=1 Tax=Oscillatoria sp. CS-180 TaxID=3021720 RepID=UPI00232EA1B3|nr:TIGR04282 family arsenosugar biosynthesis glycosyltransferase [Oscillatoria sp. CS-180]MDB9529144.1 TIGR04282 family arsenosugar biosynthesis glycosyltransferase [Oscillatoria sp. CS-180]